MSLRQPSTASRTAGSRSPYLHLIGQDRVRTLLPTPSLVIDFDALERNIARMASFARSAGLALRPHVKTHKSVEIARRQVAAGAVGVCCATLDEAEVMVEGGVHGVLLTSPIISRDKLQRYCALLAVSPDMLLVIDHPEAAAGLAEQAAAAGAKANVLLDVDVGYHRTGVRRPAQISDTLRSIENQPALGLQGLQAYSGAIQHVADLAERTEVVRTQEAMLRTLRRDLEVRLGRPLIVSGGGTGTHRLEAAEGVLTELQAGSYVFMDADYRRIDLGLQGDAMFETALFVRATVTGVNSAASESPNGFVTIDAGTKSFALNGPLPECATAPWQLTGFRFMGDEHAHLIDVGAGLPDLGVGLEFVASHCDPTVHHFDHYYVLRDQSLIDIWPVDARGRR